MGQNNVFSQRVESFLQYFRHPGHLLRPEQVRPVHDDFQIGAAHIVQITAGLFRGADNIACFRLNAQGNAIILSIPEDYLRRAHQIGPCGLCQVVLMPGPFILWVPGAGAEGDNGDFQKPGDPALGFKLPAAPGSGVFIRVDHIKGSGEGVQGDAVLLCQGRNGQKRFLVHPFRQGRQSGGGKVELGVVDALAVHFPEHRFQGHMRIGSGKNTDFHITALLPHLPAGPTGPLPAQTGRWQSGPA